jgi:hypothetical protein
VDLVDAFTEALTGTTTPPPQTGPELVDYAGGAPALARLDTGLPVTGRLPPKGQEPRRLYENAKRRYQRWAAPEGKQRTAHPPQGVYDDLRRRLIIARRAPLIPDARRRGARARIKAWVIVSSPGAKRQDRRLRSLPSGGPGQYLDRTTVQDVTDSFIAGDADTAAATFLETFLESYGFAEAEVEDVESITIWPDGTPEP